MRNLNAVLMSQKNPETSPAGAELRSKRFTAGEIRAQLPPAKIQPMVPTDWDLRDLSSVTLTPTLTFLNQSVVRFQA